MSTPASVIVDGMADDFNQFMREGSLNLVTFTRKIDPNLNIDNPRKLLRVHFVLTRKTPTHPGVVDFVADLPSRLRRIYTSIRRDTEVSENEVRGPIDWSETLRERHKRDPRTKTVYSSIVAEKDYEIPENFVLIRLVEVIRDILLSDISYTFGSKIPAWMASWKGREDLVKLLNDLYTKNVYLKRMQHLGSDVTRQMILRAMKSRNVLYREAGQLMLRYMKLMDFEVDSSEAKELLRNTFITPDRTDVLFELYWAISIAKQYRDCRFQVIEPGSNVIARWRSDENIYEMYHDSTGSLNFEEDIRGLGATLRDVDNPFGRQLRVHETLAKMLPDRDFSWSGRPDILIEKRDRTDKIVEIFIGEVKYTSDSRYAAIGLKELLEYMASAKEEAKYFEEYANLLDNPKRVKGGLFVDRPEGFEPKSLPNIVIRTFGEDPALLM